MKKENLLKLFQNQTKEKIYQEILRLSDELPFFDPAWKTEEKRVVGCQSLMYLHAELKEGKLHFAALSDALISKGLAALLIYFYEGMAPQDLFKNPPTFLQELGILESLSPTRASGVASLWLKMKQETVRLVLAHQTQASTPLPADLCTKAPASPAQSP